MHWLIYIATCPEQGLMYANTPKFKPTSRAREGWTQWTGRRATVVLIACMKWKRLDGVHERRAQRVAEHCSRNETDTYITTTKRIWIVAVLSHILCAFAAKRYYLRDQGAQQPEEGQSSAGRCSGDAMDSRLLQVNLEGVRMLCTGYFWKGWLIHAHVRSCGRTSVLACVHQMNGQDHAYTVYRHGWSELN